MTVVITRPARADAVGSLQPDDVADLLAMYERCSPETTYRRWHGHVRTFPAKYLAALLGDSDEHIAVVAHRAGQLVGLASAGAAAPGVREIGILVEDSWQRRGVGRELLKHLVAEAIVLGTDTLRAEVLTEDAGLLGPLRAFGPTSARPSAGVVTAQVRLRA
jgi:GNAT superfamily N-acetyltransferase